MRILRSLFLLLGAVLFCPISAQCAELPEGESRFERISVRDGLSQSTVFSIAQDQHGFLWFATEDGLNKYDGYNFIHYRHHSYDPESISSNWVSTVIVSRDGTLWVATRKGLDRFNRSSAKFQHFPFPGSEREVWGLREDSRGDLWLGTGRGLERFIPLRGVFKHYDIATSPGELVAVYDVLEDQPDSLLLATWGAGLLRFAVTDGSVEISQAAPGNSNRLGIHHARVLHRDRQGDLWVGTNQGLFRSRRDTQRFEKFTLGEVEEPLEITSFLEEESGVLWIGTLGKGVYALSSNRARQVQLRQEIGNPYSLSHDSVWSLHKDRTGVLWIGTGTGGGLNKLMAASRFRTYRYSDTKAVSLSDNVIWAVLSDRDGVVWVGTRNGLDALDRGNGDARHYYNEVNNSDSLSSSYVWALAEGRGDDLWVGTFANGLNRLDRRTGLVRRIPLGLGEETKSENAVRALLFDRAGRLWIGTNGGGLLRLDPDSGVRVSFRMVPNDSESLSANEVWAIAESHDGTLWVGTDGGGLNHFDPNTGRVRRFRHKSADPESLGGDRVWSLHETADGTLWIGIKDGGLSRFDPRTGKIRRFTEENSNLPNDTIYGIAEDAAGRLWLSTNGGLSCFDPVAKSFINFDIGHGLQSNEFNLGAHGQSRDGELFFGGIDGLNSFYPDQALSVSEVRSPVVITGFSKFGTLMREELQAGEKIRLSHDENFFSFSFAVLDFESPRSNQYQYKLDGVDADWRNADAANRIASYTFIPPGEYVFRVRGSNSRSVLKGDGTFVKVSILPPFYDRIWFRALTSLVLVGVTLGGASYWHRRRNQIRSMLVEGREQERRDLAENIHHGPLHALMTQVHAIDDLCGTREDSVFPDVMQNRLRRLRMALVEISDSLRTVCWILRPPTLDRFGLGLAIRDYFDKLAEAAEANGSFMPEPVFELQPAEGLLADHVQSQLFRIYQNLLNNVVRHAQAQTVRIRLQASRTQVLLEIQDTGRGFDSKKLLEFAKDRHYGLFTAEERARSMGGNFHLETSPGRGTVVRVVLPLTGRLTSLSERWKLWKNSST